MKTFKLFVFGIMLTLAGSAHGQLSVNVHIGTPPAWGPAGYDNARYYYLPDVEAYYDVPSSMFIYFSGNRWIHRHQLPPRYRDYDLYHGHKVVVNDYRGNYPYYHFREHRMKYGRGYRGEYQRNIGERRTRDNYEQHNDYERNQNLHRDDDRGRGRFDKHNDRHDDNREQEHGNGHGRGNGNGHGRGNGKED